MSDSRAMPRPRLVAPPGACDTHMHFYDARYSTAPTATVTPPDAWVPAYRALQQRLGLERVVVVQPSTYGADNRCTLAAMAEFGSLARGIAVVDTSVADAELERLTKAGIRGIRFHMMPGGALPWDILPEMAARVHGFGWHVQLQMDGRMLHEREAMLTKLPGRLVVDHVGRFMGPVGTDHPGFQLLLRLIEGGRCWVKLSAPYESKTAPPGYGHVGVLARALVRAAPERMLWASNWPHPGQATKPDEAALLDLLLDWADDDATRRRILVDNPAEVYGF